MWAATAWDEKGWLEDGGGWTVMGRLRERQRGLLTEAEAARRRLEESAGTMRMMTAASSAADYEDGLRAKWKGGPTVLAFLFAQPDTGPIRALDADGEYFDLRSGSTWDLFFPGYHRANERRAGSVSVGSNFASDWLFSAHDFDLLRRHVEDASEQRWRYSGLGDLVLVCAWLDRRGEPTIDWSSTISGSIAAVSGAGALTINEVIERISRDLESGEEDANFGVGEITDPRDPRPSTGVGRDLIIGALSGIATALGERGLGI